MSKDKITEHGLLYDFINYKTLIEAQSNNRKFVRDNFNNKIYKYTSKPKIKKLKLQSHKKIIK